MKTSTWAKIAGWAQFALQSLGQVAQGGAPHGALSWIGLIGSLVTAVAIHGASSTDGGK